MKKHWRTGVPEAAPARYRRLRKELNKCACREYGSQSFRQQLEIVPKRGYVKP